MEWEIGGKAVNCAECGKAFDEEEELFSALFDDQAAFARKDYCVGCWDGGGARAAFSFWRTRVPRRDEPVRRIVDDDVLIDLFQRLEGAEEENRRNFRFVVALLLMRRKVLRYVELKREADGSALVLHDRIRGCRCEVADPGLTEEQIQQVTEEVAQLLNMRP
jgi:hypothetical protein